MGRRRCVDYEAPLYRSARALARAAQLVCRDAVASRDPDPAPPMRATRNFPPTRWCEGAGGALGDYTNTLRGSSHLPCKKTR